MDWIVPIAVALPTLLLFLIGYLIRFRKQYGLISGYNTMSEEKKKNVDVEGLGRLMGNALFLMGFLIGAGMLLLFKDQGVAGICVIGLSLPVVVFLLIRAQKYDRNDRAPDGRMKSRSKFAIAGFVVFLAVVAGGVGYLFAQGSQPTSAVLADGGLKISGLYGQTVPVADIRKVELVFALPTVEARTNGSAIGDLLSGHFRLADVGAALLFLDRSKPPFLYVETATQKIYLNLATPAETQTLYESLSTATLPFDQKPLG